MENKKDNPGVYIPPPLFYVLTFLAAVFIQKQIPIADSLFHQQLTKIAGAFFLIIALFFLVKSLRQFVQTRNTLVTIKPKFGGGFNSKAQKGIARTHNMYLCFSGVFCSA